MTGVLHFFESDPRNVKSWPPPCFCLCLVLGMGGHELRMGWEWFRHGLGTDMPFKNILGIGKLFFALKGHACHGFHLMSYLGHAQCFGLFVGILLRMGMPIYAHPYLCWLLVYNKRPGRLQLTPLEFCC